MTTARLPEAPHMLILDCPLCDGPATFDDADGELQCPACSVRLALAADEPVVLAAAA